MRQHANGYSHRWMRRGRATAVAHPTKKVTRGRMKMGGTLLRGHRRFPVKYLIHRVLNWFAS